MKAHRILRNAVALLLSIAGLSCGFSCDTASAETVAQFYTGKQIHLLVGYPAGSGYDFAARVLAKHMTRHIPGKPGIVVEQMVGAASIKAAMYLYAKAPRDGTYIASLGRGALAAPLLDPATAQYDLFKYTFLGSMNGTTFVGFAWAGSGIKSVADLRTRAVNAGASAHGSDSYSFSSMLNTLAGTKLKIVSGYPGSNDVFLAGERNEVQAYFGVSLATIVSTQNDLIKDKKINFLVQFGEEKDAALPDVPLVTEFLTSDEARKAASIILAPNLVARPFFAPPDVPKDRADALAKAFDDTMKDPEFLDEAKKALLEVSPKTGTEVRALMKRVYDSPPNAVAAARDAVGQ